MVDYDWTELAFGSKKSLNQLKPTFIVAPREISTTRLSQIIKQYLPQGNIVLGLAKEKFIHGFEGQPQFQTLAGRDVEELIDKVNASVKGRQIVKLWYFQRELPYILEKLSLQRVVLVNGSWRYVFHSLPVYYQLVKQGTPFESISPFADEAEAKAFARRYVKLIEKSLKIGPSIGDERQMLTLADEVAKRSFDNSYQTGLVLAKKDGKTYRLLETAHNQIVPYETYAMHHGPAREVHFSPTHDLNHYDTVHAEISIIIKAGKLLAGGTVFINLMPCPTCARALAATDIKEIVYSQDHSDGYAVKMLEAAGKKVRRLVL